MKDENGVGMHVLSSLDKKIFFSSFLVQKVLYERVHHSLTNKLTYVFFPYMIKNKGYKTYFV